MKLTLKTIKPRNPFVAASLRRSAGAHRADSGQRRQQLARETRMEVRRETDRSRPSP